MSLGGVFTFVVFYLWSLVGLSRGRRSWRMPGGVGDGEISKYLTQIRCSGGATQFRKHLSAWGFSTCGYLFRHVLAYSGAVDVSEGQLDQIPNRNPTMATFIVVMRLLPRLGFCIRAFPGTFRGVRLQRAMTGLAMGKQATYPKRIRRAKTHLPE